MKLQNAIIAGAIGVAFAALVQAQEAPSIVGKWTFTDPRNSCKEMYEFRADGTSTARSGTEKTDDTYSITSEPDANGFYALTIKTEKDFGGKDCGESEDDNTGQTSTVYLLFHPTGNAYIFCHTPAFQRCFGPYKKVQ